MEPWRLLLSSPLLLQSFGNVVGEPKEQVLAALKGGEAVL
jgi:hypothetical protein